MMTRQDRLRSRFFQCLLITMISLGATFGARAAVTGVTQCSATNFTINVEGFPNSVITAQLMLNPTGEVILNTTYNFAAQTLVAVRPPTLAGGTYLVNFYSNGVWIAQANLNICSQSGGTSNLFPAIFRAVCVSTNARGLAYEKVTNSDLIQECAAEHSLTNSRNLRLVYNRAEDALQVVGSTNQFNTNQTILCTVLSFEGGTSLTNTNNSVAARLAFVFVGTNLVSSGTFVGTEHLTYGSTNQLTRFRLSGNLAYSVAASGTNGAQICRGVLLAGTAAGANGGQDDEDDDDDHGNGNHGNNQNNGNHGNNQNNGNQGNDHGNGHDRDEDKGNK